MEQPEEEEPTTMENMKYYTTLTLGTTACVSSFVFMFTIPWVLDPSISTLLAKFDDQQVVCQTVHSEYKFGNKNCTWTSCKHGCTADMYECEQIHVNYMLIPYDEFNEEEEYNDTMWVGRGIPLLVNIKGCGYPESVNCTVFSSNYSTVSMTFGCYYSHVDPDLVITDYNWYTEVQSIITALLVPNVLCGISLGVVSYWWYPGCQKNRCQYQVPPDQEDASINTGNEDEDDDEDEEDEDEEGGDAKEPDKNDNETTGKKSRVSEDDEKELDTTINMPEE